MNRYSKKDRKVSAERKNESSPPNANKPQCSGKFRLLPFNLSWKSEKEVSKSKNKLPSHASIYSFCQTIHGSGIVSIAGVVKQWTEQVPNKANRADFKQWVAPARQIRIWCFGKLKRFLLYPSITFCQVQEGCELVQENPPGTNLDVLRSTPRYLFPQVWFCQFQLPGARRIPIFPRTGSWNIPTRISQYQGSKHAWYKWFHGSKNSKTLHPDGKIQIPVIITARLP